MFDSRNRVPKNAQLLHRISVILRHASSWPMNFIASLIRSRGGLQLWGPHTPHEWRRLRRRSRRTSKPCSSASSRRRWSRVRSCGGLAKPWQQTSSRGSSGRLPHHRLHHHRLPHHRLHHHGLPHHRLQRLPRHRLDQHRLPHHRLHHQRLHPRLPPTLPRDSMSRQRPQSQLHRRLPRHRRLQRNQMLRHRRLPRTSRLVRPLPPHGWSPTSSRTTSSTTASTSRRS